MYKHYIEKDDENNVTHAFSDAFEEPGGNSILLRETQERHFNIQPYKVYVDGFMLYRWTYYGGDVHLKEETDYGREIDQFKQDNNNKWQKIKEIRKTLLAKANWVNGLFVAQEHGHGKGLNKKTNRLLEEANYDAWAEWFEDIGFLHQDLVLDTINYDDITPDNTAIFPAMPNFPDDIV